MFSSSLKGSSFQQQIFALSKRRTRILSVVDPNSLNLDPDPDPEFWVNFLFYFYDSNPLTSELLHWPARIGSAWAAFPCPTAPGSSSPPDAPLCPWTYTRLQSWALYLYSLRLPDLDIESLTFFGFFLVSEALLHRVDCREAKTLSRSQLWMFTQNAYTVSSLLCAGSAPSRIHIFLPDPIKNYFRTNVVFHLT